jgi:hypothetical protein
MTVKRHLVGFGRFGDRIDAHAAKTVFSEQIAGRFDYALSWRRAGAFAFPGHLITLQNLCRRRLTGVTGLYHFSVTYR